MPPLDTTPLLPRAWEPTQNAAGSGALLGESDPDESGRWAWWGSAWQL